MVGTYECVNSGSVLSLKCIRFTDIQSKLRRIEEDPEGGTEYLYTCIQGVNSMANRAFEPLLERQVNIILD